jgi:uncharacterized protein (TIGR00369 family)
MTEPPTAGHDREDVQTVLESTGESEHAECLFCGKRNPIGFKLGFHARDDGSVRAEFTGTRSLQGYPKTLHGGVVSALLDSAMTNCLFSRGVVAVTAELNVRFLVPVSLDRPVRVAAAVTRSRGRLHYLRAELTQDGNVAARASSTFMERRAATAHRGTTARLAATGAG